MLNSIQEIKANPIVNRFNEISQTYNIDGVYVNWCPGGLNEGGVYFVCGLDKTKIHQEDLDVYKIIGDMRNSGGDICTGVSAFKIDGQHPLIAHRNVVNYCQQLNILQNVYGHFNEKVPAKIAPSVVEIMDVAWRHFADPEKSSASKKAHEDTLRYAVGLVKKNQDISSPEYKKYQYLANGYYDSGKGKLYNWAKMHFAKYKNEVTLSHLVNHAGRINFATVTYANYPQVKAELEQRPGILYHFSEVRGNKLDVNENDGFGSKEKNDRRYFTLHYPAVYTKDIEKIFLKINYPEEFCRTIEDIDPHNRGVEYMIVPDEYFDMFRDLCDSNNVKICIDRNSYDTIYGGIPVVFSAEYSAKTYAMLNYAIEAFEKDIAPCFSLNKNTKPEIEEPSLKTSNYYTPNIAER